MEIYLNTGHLFTVPTAVADHFLKLASGDQLKVLLYVLCHADTALTAAQIAQHCGVKPAAVEEALTFWQSVNILSEQSGGIPAVRQPVQTAEPQPATSVQATESPVPAQKPVQLSSTVWAIDPAEMAERIKADKTISDMFSIVELNAGGLLNHTVQKCLLWMHEYLGLSPDIIVMLAAYCNEIGCFQVRYMEKIALEWQERGILTHEAAQQDIQRMESARSFTGQIMRMFEMDRKPTAKQQGFIDGWAKLGLPAELIRLAYEKTRDATDDKLSFPYIDTILQRWAAAGIRTVEAAEQDAAAFQAARQKKKSGSGQVGKEKTPRGERQSSIDPETVEKLINAF